MIIDCKSIAENIKSTTRHGVQKLNQQPDLFIIEVGDDFSSNAYMKGKLKDCIDTGIAHNYIKFPSSISESKLLHCIKSCNKNKKCTGISIQFPLPSHIDKSKILREILYSKDVDGFRPESPYEACTAKAIINILTSTNIKLVGKHCVIVGRSDIVGKPLIEMILQENMTVTVCHSYTPDISQYTLQADVLISATGVPNIINGNIVKQDVIAIDVGTNLGKDGKLCGDFDFDSVFQKSSFITTVPNGVGLVTRAVLMNNVIKAAKIQEENVFEI